MTVPAITINEKTLKKIEDMAAKGLTLDKIAEAFGIHVATFHEYKKKYPEINAAWRKGKYTGEHEVASALYRKAVEEGSVDAMKFYLSRRGGKEWQESVDVNLIPKPTIIKRYGTNEEVVLGVEDDTSKSEE